MTMTNTPKTVQADPFQLKIDGTYNLLIGGTYQLSIQGATGGMTNITKN